MKNKITIKSKSEFNKWLDIANDVGMGCSTK